MPNTFVQKGNTRMEVAVSSLPVWLSAGWSEQAAPTAQKTEQPKPQSTPATVQQASTIPSPPPATSAPTTVQQPTAAPQTTKMATLVNAATGQRVAVPVGSQEAQGYFGQGFVLETQAPKTQANPTTTQTPTSQTPQFNESGGIGVAQYGPEVPSGVISKSRADAINSLIGQGVTDPNQLLNYLNYDESGKLTGDFTPEEVNNALSGTNVVKAKADAEAKQAAAEQERQSQLNAILTKYGIGQQDETKSPVNRAMEAYKTVLESLGVPTVKAKMAEIEKEYAALQEQKRVEAAEIEDNPWLVEGVRRDRLAAVDRKYEAKETNLTGRLAQFKDIYDQGVEQAKYVSGMAVQEQEAKDALKEKMATLEMESLFKKADVSADVEGYLTALETGFKGDFVDYKNAIAGRTGEAGGDFQYISATKQQAGGVFDKNTGKFTPTSGGVSSGAKAGTGTTSTTGGVAKKKLSTRAQQVFDNPSLLAQYTPTEKGKILDEIASAGFKFDASTLEKVSAGQRDSLAKMDDLLTSANLAQNILDTGLNTGPVASRLKSVQAAFGQASPEYVNYSSAISNLNSTIFFLRSGAAVTPSEAERLKGFVPNINDDQKTAKMKIKDFISAYNEIRANYVKRSTQTTSQIIQSVQPQTGAGTFSSSGGNSYKLPY